MFRVALRRLRIVASLLGASWALRKFLHIYARYSGPTRFRHQLSRAKSIRVVIGSTSRYDPGWISTEVDFLDLTKPEDWARYFHPSSIDALLAEHVWEHLTVTEGGPAAQTCFEYLKPGGYLRVAVPDGFHPSADYQRRVRVGGTTPWNGHKSLYTYQTFRELFEGAGFEVTLYEYFDEAGTFHYKEWDRSAGTIWRSKRFDRRNQGGELAFTSIVLDARKPAAVASTAQTAITTPPQRSG